MSTLLSIMGDFLKSIMGKNFSIIGQGLIATEVFWYTQDKDIIIKHFIKRI